LREVYWNDPRRRQLRARVQSALTLPVGEVALMSSAALLETKSSAARSVTLGSDSEPTPLERRLARILEVNSELACEHDVERLTARIVDHAVDLLRAERGFLLLLRADGSLSVHTSRSRFAADAHVDFSRSIAASVIETGEPV